MGEEPDHFRGDSEGRGPFGLYRSPTSRPFHDVHCGIAAISSSSSVTSASTALLKFSSLRSFQVSANLRGKLIANVAFLFQALVDDPCQLIRDSRIQFARRGWVFLNDEQEQHASRIAIEPSTYSEGYYKQLSWLQTKSRVC